MTLRTRILLAGGTLRFGGTGLILVGSRLHWPGVVAALLWMFYCRPVLRYVLLPALFPYTRCPKCHYVIPLRQRWGCGEHYRDHKVRHVLAFHCNEGHEIKQFECPQRDCRSTIQVQKRVDHKLSKGVVLGNAFYFAPGERVCLLRRIWKRMRFWKRRAKGLTLPLGYSRQLAHGRLWRWIKRLLGRDTRKIITVPESVYGRHMTIFGKSGMGKSKFILGLAQWIFENDMGATFVDKAGDLANDIIRIVPKERQDDVLWIRIADNKCPFQLNLLEAKDVDEEIDLNEELLHSLKQISHSWGENIAHQIEIGVDTARAVGGSLKTVHDLFANARTRASTLAQMDDPALLDFWDKYENSRDSTRAPVIRKLRQLVKHKRLGPMLSARKSNFDADAIIRDRKIVVLDLSTGSASQQVNIVLGTFIIGKIRAAAFRQQFLKEEERVRHWLVVDEAKNFMHKGMDFEKIFSEARKFKLTLVLANQNVSQMNDDVRTEAFGNAGVLVAFNVDNTDAKLFAERMPNVSVDEITMQGVGECVAKIHNAAHFVKTELPVIPEYDPTAHIEAKMRELNQQESDDEVCGDSENGYAAVDLSPYLATVIEGVR
jgi:hypothetical protein